MCRLLNWSSKASRRSSNCISNSCSSMRTDFLKLCSWSASYLYKIHYKKNSGVHCTQLHIAKEELGMTIPRAKDSMQGISRWNTGNSSFTKNHLKVWKGTKVLLHLWKGSLEKIYHSMLKTKQGVSQFLAL